MDSRISKLTSSLKQIGEIQVTEWDFMGLLHTEIHELELARSLRRLGAMKVTEWEFSDVIPAIRQTANREVDLAGIFRKGSRSKMMERDFNPTGSSGSKTGKKAPDEELPNLDQIGKRLGGFLRFVVTRLIDKPEEARFQVKAMGPTGLCFEVRLARRDVTALIGREGHTAGAIRRIFQAMGERNGVQVLLHIRANDEDGGDAG